VRQDHQAVGAAAGSGVVVAPGERHDRLGELLAEGGTVRGGTETDLGVDRERRQPLDNLFCQGGQSRPC
jgi:hypothetical protein